MESRTIRLVDPTFSPTRSTIAQKFAARPANLKGARLGLLANGKTHGDRVLEEIAAGLQQQFGAGESFLLTKKHPSQPVSERDVLRFARDADVVITAVGDCGSCSSCSAVDVLTLEDMGIPSALVITEPFVVTVQAMAEVKGAPALEFAVMDHPLTNLPVEDVKAKAAEAVPEIARILLGHDDATTAGTVSALSPLALGALDAKLQPFRDSLAADGAALDLLEVDNDRRLVRFHLDVKDATCETECVIPASSLQKMLESVLHQSFGSDVVVDVVQETWQ